jgi:hypothetical protein
MLRKLPLCLAALLVASPAFAQSVTISQSTPQIQPLSPSLGGTESLAIVTPAQADTIIESTSIGIENEPSIIDTLPRITPAMAATLVSNDAASARNAAPLEEDVSIYVVEDGTILPASSWGENDSAACKASGGVELPLPAGRIGCFKL